MLKTKFISISNSILSPFLLKKTLVDSPQKSSKNPTKTSQMEVSHQNRREEIAAHREKRTAVPKVWGLTGSEKALGCCVYPTRVCCVCGNQKTTIFGVELRTKMAKRNLKNFRSRKSKHVMSKELSD
jgi:hypothetical protein